MAPITIAFGIFWAAGVFFLVMNEDTIVYRNRSRGVVTIVSIVGVWSFMIGTMPSTDKASVYIAAFVFSVFGAITGGALANAFRMILGKPMPESSEFDSPLFD